MYYTHACVGGKREQVKQTNCSSKPSPSSVWGSSGLLGSVKLPSSCVRFNCTKSTSAMFLKSNLRRTFRSSKACQGSSRGGAFMVALKNGERTNGSFSTDTRFFVCLLLFPPLRRPIWPISWALSRNSGFFRLQKKGEVNRGGRKRKRPPPPFVFLAAPFAFFPCSRTALPRLRCQFAKFMALPEEGRKKGGGGERERAGRPRTTKRKAILSPVPYTFQRQFLMFLGEEERKMSITIFFFVFRSRRHRRDHFLRTRGTLARTL